MKVRIVAPGWENFTGILGQGAISRTAKPI
jgi:hypothetical protein